MVAAMDYRARVDTRPAVLSKNYVEIGFDTFLPRSDSTRPKDSAESRESC